MPTKKPTAKKPVTKPAPKKKAAPARAPSPKLREHAQEIAKRLAAEIPSPHIELHFENPWQLLMAVILSAQSTDKMINTITPVLFKRWPNPKALAAAPQEEVEEVVKSSGFFRNKAKSIRNACAALVEKHGGQVPRTIEELIEVPGVARKTANAVLAAAYDIGVGMVVDTHAMRVSQRLGLTKHTDPEKIEEALCALFPNELWTRIGNRFVLHGRHVCLAKNPKCTVCPLNEVCPSRQEAPEAGTSWEQRARRIAQRMEELASGFQHVGSAPTVVKS